MKMKLNFKTLKPYSLTFCVHGVGYLNLVKFVMSDVVLCCMLVSTS